LAQLSGQKQRETAAEQAPYAIAEHSNNLHDASPRLKSKK
jgi:hypothetical protein